MNFLHFFLINLIFIPIINCSVRCHTGTKYVKTRKFIKNELMNQNSVVIVTDYSTFQNSTRESDDKSFIKFLYASTNFEVPIVFVNKTKNNDMFIIKFHSNMVSYSNFGLEIISEDVKKNNGLNRENCADEKLNMKHWRIKSELSFCLAMYSCHIFTFSNRNDIKKELIFLTDEHFNISLSQAFISSKNFERKKLTFLEFDQQGFCICDDVLNYINDCKIKEKKINLFNFIVPVLVLIIVILIIFEIHEYIAKKKRVSTG